MGVFWTRFPYGVTEFENRENTSLRRLEQAAGTLAEMLRLWHEWGTGKVESVSAFQVADGRFDHHATSTATSTIHLPSAFQSKPALPSLPRCSHSDWDRYAIKKDENKVRSNASEVVKQVERDSAICSYANNLRFTHKEWARRSHDGGRLESSLEFRGRGRKFGK